MNRVQYCFLSRCGVGALAWELCHHNAIGIYSRNDTVSVIIFVLIAINAYRHADSEMMGLPRYHINRVFSQIK